MEEKYDGAGFSDCLNLISGSFLWHEFKSFDQSIFESGTELFITLDNITNLYYYTVSLYTVTRYKVKLSKNNKRSL